MAHAIYYPVVEVLSSIAIACVIWFGGKQRHPAGSPRIGVLVAFMQYAQRFFRPIQDLSEKYNILQSAMASSERIFKLLDTPAEIVTSRVAKKPEGPGAHRVRSRLVCLPQTRGAAGRSTRHSKRRGD